MNIETRSENPRKALAANSQATDYAFLGFNLQTAEPLGDGVHDAGFGGTTAPSRILLLPYVEGSEFARFAMRVYGWFHDVDISPTALVWFPVLLGEFVCRSCNRRGPSRQAAGDARYIKDNERMCDAIQQTMGFQGQISSPGSNILSAAIIPLLGCRKFQFDFKQIDVNIGMNAMWAKL